MKPWAKNLFGKTIDEIDIHNELYPRDENWDEHTSGSYLFTTCRESWHKYAYDGSSRRIIAYVANLSQLLDYEFDGHFIQTMAPGANTSNVCRFVSDNGYTFEVAQTSYDDIRSYCYCLVYKAGG